MGETAKAMTVVEQLGKLPYPQPYWVARIHAALGNTDEALTWLEKAYEDRSELLILSGAAPQDGVGHVAEVTRLA